MKVILKNTSKIVELDGLPARVWEGETETGIKCHAFITRIAIDKDEPRVEEFRKELQEVNPPSAEVSMIPHKIIL